MGCASSKEKVCKHCKDSISPVRRSHSVHHKSDTNHAVSLTSSTLGSLRLDSSSSIVPNHNDVENGKNQLLKHLFIVDDKCLVEDNVVVGKEKGSVKEEFAMGMIEAKTWSNMINEKIPKIVPKTPSRTPPGEPETINAWELMEGLEDISPLRPVQHIRSFSFQVPRNYNLLSSIDDQPTPRVKENGDDLSPKLPLWVDSDSNTNSNENSIVSEFDPEVIATFRKALEDLPPASPFHLKDWEVEANEKNVRRGVDKLIVYFTSLRGVRKTFEDCCHVRVILKGLGVKVDERDMSMHSGFKDELKELLGEGFGKGGLPRVFIGKRYIGGADEIRQLNEEGKLEKLVEGCELMDDVDGNVKGCEACGDIRFVPCETCSGSCKIYYEGDYDEEVVDDGSENEFGFQRCPDCNENGLIRCPICCD